MNLKTLLKTALIMLCISLSLPAFSNSINPEMAIASDDGAKPAKTVDPMVRLQEIKNMDIANLSRAEKKGLRKEIKAIRKEVRAGKSGIYLSLGAVVIIVLLLIILL